MKISEMIAKLMEVKELAGDVEVKVFVYDYYTKYPREATICGGPNSSRRYTISYSPGRISFLKVDLDSPNDFGEISRPKITFRKDS